jgi:hypothetical protein
VQIQTCNLYYTTTNNESHGLKNSAVFVKTEKIRLDWLKNRIVFENTELVTIAGFQSLREQASHVFPDRLLKQKSGFPPSVSPLPTKIKFDATIESCVKFSD